MIPYKKIVYVISRFDLEPEASGRSVGMSKE
jgi:hypothetical protein